MTWKLAGRVVAVAVLFVAGWIAYYMLIDVNREDITYSADLERTAFSPGIRAGDLVAVSPDNLSLSHLCRMDVPRNDVSEQLIDRRYVNGLAQSLGGFVVLVEGVWSWFGGNQSGTEVEAARFNLPFRGRVTEVVQESRPVPREQCPCAIAEAILARAKVCVVAKSMIETQEVRSLPFDANSPMVVTERTIGLTFRPRPMLVDLKAVNCQLPNTEVILPSDQTCSGVQGYSPAVRLRGTLGVIREEDLLVRN